MWLKYVGPAGGRLPRDLGTLAELEAMAHAGRGAAVDRGLPYLEIAQKTHASTTTVTRVAHWLRHGEGGYRLALDRHEGGDVDRADDRVPVKGRLREPSVSLLVDAGLGPEQPGERALPSPAGSSGRRLARRARPTFRSTCRTGSSTAGSPARTLCASAARASRSCSSSGSAPAGSRSRCPRSRRTSADRGSCRRAASRRFFRARARADAGRGRARRRDGLGRDRAPARARRRDRRPVSSGNTLRMNGLRSLGVPSAPRRR